MSLVLQGYKSARKWAVTDSFNTSREYLASSMSYYLTTYFASHVVQHPLWLIWALFASGLDESTTHWVFFRGQSRWDTTSGIYEVLFWGLTAGAHAWRSLALSSTVQWSTCVVRIAVHPISAAHALVPECVQDFQGFGSDSKLFSVRHLFLILRGQPWLLLGWVKRLNK